MKRNQDNCSVSYERSKTIFIKDNLPIKQFGNLNAEIVEWNNRMYQKHPTPYQGLAGFIERARVRTVLKFTSIKPNDAVLEIGCEAGNLLFQCPKVKRIVGVDISSSALQDAYQLFKANNRSAEFIHIDAQLPLPFLKGEFSVIICSEVLEHVSDPRSVLENIYRISNAETRILITIPTEATKLFIKNVLRKLRIFNLLFPGIEENQSEWHLHAFSKNKLFSLNHDLFQIKKSTVVWLNHFVALMSLKSN